uniref:Uncharacterized protein n=1 Tax=Plectus sambesii TaxID=2011161 RepID=A0A914XHL6_9BILA
MPIFGKTRLDSLLERLFHLRPGRKLREKAEIRKLDPIDSFLSRSRKDFVQRWDNKAVGSGPSDVGMKLWNRGALNTDEQDDERRKPDDGRNRKTALERLRAHRESAGTRPSGTQIEPFSLIWPRAHTQDSSRAGLSAQTNVTVRWTHARRRRRRPPPSSCCYSLLRRR